MVLGSQGCSPHERFGVLINDAPEILLPFPPSECVTGRLSKTRKRALTGPWLDLGLLTSRAVRSRSLLLTSYSVGDLCQSSPDRLNQRENHLKRETAGLGGLAPFALGHAMKMVELAPKLKPPSPPVTLQTETA